MPRRLKTRCCFPGCPALCRGRFCERHARHNRSPSDYRRASGAARGYDRHWEAVRQWHLRRHPLCEDCLEQGIVNGTNLEVDHILPIEVRPDLRLDLANLRTRCRRHHQIKTLSDKQKYGAALTSQRTFIAPTS